MSKPAPLGKLSIGFEQCAMCDENTSGMRVDGDCPTCGGVGTTPYWRPPRWVELMVAIVTRTDRFGSWFLGGKRGEYVVISGRNRTIRTERGGSCKRSARSLVEKGLVLVGSLEDYTPTEAGREALRWALFKFDAACERKGPPPRKLTPGPTRKRSPRRRPPPRKPAPLEVAAAEYSTRHGRHYKAHLQASGLSQAELARKLADRYPVLSATAWETRLKNFPGLVGPSGKTLVALADHFDVTMESFTAPIEGDG